jgi:hypothetical protein
VIGLSLAGWLIAVTSTFLINHFELFDCVRSPTTSPAATPAPRFRTPLYLQVRAPPSIWVHRVLGGGHVDGRHLLFATMTTAHTSSAPC